MSVMPNLARQLTPGAAPYEVVFNAVNVPALGFSTYFISSSNASTPSAPTTGLASLMKPFKAVASLLAADVEAKVTTAVEVTQAAFQAQQGMAADPTIHNNFWTLTFDGTTGLMKSITDVASGTVYPLAQSFYYYNGYQVPQEQDSGAYIFRADESNATATPVAPTKLQSFSYIDGPVVSEFRQVYTPWLSQVIRVTAGSIPIEFEWSHLSLSDPTHPVTTPP
jgi:hypothetical protein